MVGRVCIMEPPKADDDKPAFFISCSFSAAEWGGVEGMVGSVSAPAHERPPQKQTCYPLGDGESLNRVFFLEVISQTAGLEGRLSMPRFFFLGHSA